MTAKPGHPIHRKFHPFAYRLDGQIRWLLWYTNALDGFDVRNGQLRSFESLSALKANLRQRLIDLEQEGEEPALFDLDRLAAWLAEPRSATIDASAMLNAWNAFADVAASLGETLADRGAWRDELYDRLFHYGGPEWHTGRAEGATADWTPEEVQLLAEVLSAGLSLFRTAVDPDRA